MKPFPVTAVEAAQILSALRKAQKQVKVLVDGTDGAAREHAVTASSALYHVEQALSWMKDAYDWETTV